MIERLTLVNHNGDHYLSKSMNGEFVRHSDYEALESRCRELEAERDNLADKIRWMDPLIKEHHDAGQVYWEKWQAAQAHAQKLTEALEPFAKEADGRRSKGVIGGVLFKQDDLLAAREALSLTSTSALAAVRDEVREAVLKEREECAKIVAEYGGHPKEVVSFISDEIASAIRARKETGE